MTEPSGVSLRKLGLRTRDVDAMWCPADGGYHEVDEREVLVAKVHGGGAPICHKCGVPVVLVPLDED
jgi:hypothetical protein